MAMQFHVAFSKIIPAVGILAGLPYSCGIDGDWQVCIHPENVSISRIFNEIDKQASEGKIDDTSYINGANVFLWHGTIDANVPLASSFQIKEIYEYYGANVKTNFDIPSGHGFPTDSYGAPCGLSTPDFHYINNCSYQGAYETLKNLLGDDLVAPSSSTTLDGQLIEFEQGEFVAGGDAFEASMDDFGYVYVPSGCVDKSYECKLHIAFHGCQQSKGIVGDIYVTKTGYLEVAELNNIIVLFPQIAANDLIRNDFSCWDYSAYTNDEFLNKDGLQMDAVYKMLRRVVDGYVAA